MRFIGTIMAFFSCVIRKILAKPLFCLRFYFSIMALTIAQKETIQKYFNEGRRISEISEMMELSRETIRKLKPKRGGIGNMPAEFYCRMIDLHQQERENDSSIE